MCIFQRALTGKRVALFLLLLLMLKGGIVKGVPRIAIISDLLYFAN